MICKLTSAVERFLPRKQERRLILLVSKLLLCYNVQAIGDVYEKQLTVCNPEINDLGQNR